MPLPCQTSVSLFRHAWMGICILCANIALTSATEPPAATSEVVTFEAGHGQRTVTGRVVVEDEEGGVLLEGRDGRRWVIEHQQVVDRETLAAPFAPLTHDELAEQTLAELPDGFRVHTTPHYVVCYNTSRAYAQWTSSLLERLHRAFTNYWTNQGVEIHEPEFPLVVVVYATADEYRQASREELGPSAGSVIGYFSLLSNRISMYDLTGSEAAGGGRGQRASLKDISRMLSRPAAIPLVATIVHEATHQIAFNCGLQQRLSELPLWLVEGMAVYFEAPDLTSRSGWQGIGKVNRPRLERFRSNLRSPRHLTVLSMVADDKRFRDGRTAVDAYADAWALNYYLIRYHPDEYVAYVRAMSEKMPLVPTTPEERIEEFREHFGDPAALERDFLKRMSRVK